MKTNFNYLYDLLVKLGIATEEEIRLAVDVCSEDNITALYRVLYSRTGLRTIEQLKSEYA